MPIIISPQFWGPVVRRTGEVGTATTLISAQGGGGGGEGKRRKEGAANDRTQRGCPKSQNQTAQKPFQGTSFPHFSVVCSYCSVFVQVMLFINVALVHNKFADKVPLNKQIRRSRYFLLRVIFIVGSRMRTCREMPKRDTVLKTILGRREGEEAETQTQFAIDNQANPTKKKKKWKSANPRTREMGAYLPPSLPTIFLTGLLPNPQKTSPMKPLSLRKPLHPLPPLLLLGSKWRL